MFFPRSRFLSLSVARHPGFWAIFALAHFGGGRAPLFSAIPIFAHFKGGAPPLDLLCQSIIGKDINIVMAKALIILRIIFVGATTIFMAFHIEKFMSHIEPKAALAWIAAGLIEGMLISLALMRTWISRILIIPLFLISVLFASVIPIGRFLIGHNSNIALFSAGLYFTVVLSLQGVSLYTAANITNAFESEGP